MASPSPEAPSALPVTQPVEAAAPAPSFDPLTQSLAFLQPWIDHVPRQQRRLGLFLFLAALVHLAAFFVIRIDTTRAEMNRQARTHVSVQAEPAVAQQTSSDGFWDRLTDPRLFLFPLQSLSGPSPTDPTVDLATAHSDIGSGELPAAAPVQDRPELHPDMPPLDQKVAATMKPTAQPFAYNETPPAIATQTTWEWGTSLSERQPSEPPVALPTPVSDTDLVATQLRVAVNGEGTVEHVMVEQSCGKIELDQQAVLAVNKIRFHPVEKPELQWGHLSIAWTYTVPPREVVVPTPIAP